MMHGHGKSDRPVVPVKSPNNAGPPAAEGMEGRGLAKGNPHQQNLPIGHRAGTGGPSALERVRQAAGGTGRYGSRRFCTTSTDLDTLRAAYLRLKTEGGARRGRGDMAALRQGDGGATSKTLRRG